MPNCLTLPAGDLVRLESYNDADFGFLRLTLDAAKQVLVGEYFCVLMPTQGDESRAELFETFTLDLRSHKIG